MGNAKRCTSVQALDELLLGTPPPPPTLPFPFSKPSVLWVICSFYSDQTRQFDWEEFVFIL